MNLKNKNMFLPIFFFCIFFLSSVASSMEIRLKQNLDGLQFDENEKSKIDIFLQETLDSLPNKMKAKIDKPVLVTFKNIKGENICSQVNTKHLVDGGHQVIIEEKFLKPILQEDMSNFGETKNHKNALQLVKAMLVHEIAHIYYYKIPKSELKQFKNLFEFRKKGLVRKSRKVINKKIGRSPDAYEYKNEKEAFAVNMEYFLLDPNYSCRRPARNEFLAKHFDFKPFAEDSCMPSNMLRMTGEGVLPDGQFGMYRHFDISKVYGIHYLFARQNKRITGRWGHAMYRIIVCSPTRKLVNEDCLQDIDHHLVLSFEGQIDDADMDYLKGLKGDYPIHANIQSFEFARNKYRYYEDRGLLSIPLKLEKIDARIFLKKIFEMQEEYESPYYFFSNNCATEALDFLKGTSSDLKLHDFHTNTPISMLKGLIKRDILDDSVLQDREYALRKGYLWESNSEFMKKSILGIKSIVPNFEINSYKKYIKLPSDQRIKLFNTTIEKHPNEIAKLSLYFFELEASITKSLVLSKIHRLLSLYKRGKDEQKLNDLELELFEGLKRINSDFTSLSNISDYQTNSYGIPLKEEFNEYYDQITRKLREFQAQNKEMHQIKYLFDRFFQKTNQLIEETRKNKDLIKRSFHGAA